MRREQYYFRNAKFIFIFIFCLFNVRSHGQTSCCLTNTLNISTGYDPLTASLLTPGCDGCIAVSDPGWKVSYISPDLMSVMIASGFTPGSPQADVIQNYPPYWCTSTTSDWISCFNGRGLSPIFSSGTFEYQLSRTFTLACAACVNFNLTIAADNYISDISVGSTHLYGPQDPAANNWTTAVTPSISCVNLGPGTYTIVVTAYNGLSPSAANPMGVNISGTITTASNAILSESSICCSTYQCNEPVITASLNPICVGQNSTLSNAESCGTWSSSNPDVGTIDAVSGNFGAVNGGVTNIEYTDNCGRPVYYSMTVNPLPAVITGHQFVCQGASTTLTDPGGGTWASSNTFVATIGGGGVVTGISGGTTIITYTLPTGCLITTTETVNPIEAISGTTAICVSGSGTLTDGISGGTWSSSNTTVGTVDLSSGVVAGVSVGSAVITYMMPTGCFATTTITINPLPDAITGAASVCQGSTTTLNDPGGGTWLSSNTSVATISAGGVLTGLSSGTTIITYTLPTGCSITTIETVKPIAPITGTSSFCGLGTLTLSDAVSGGVWSSSNTAVGTIGSSSSIVTGLSIGTTIITYTMPTGCEVTDVVNFKIAPTAITGTTTLCTGSSATLTGVPTGGTWYSDAVLIASITYTSGILSAVSPGTTYIQYALSDGCPIFQMVTVLASPAAVTGTSSMCVGQTVSLSDATSGGSWISGNTAVAAVGSGSGNVTGVAAGTANISYMLTDNCYSSETITVNANPDPITGTTTTCLGSTTTLSDGTTGGGAYWSTSSMTDAIGDLSGIFSGVASGTAIVTYTLPATGCYTTATITVNPLPPGISGPSTVCPGYSITLSDAEGGGFWSSDNTAVGTIGSVSGILTGISIGTTTITYTLPTGCYTTAIVTMGVPPITGDASVCVDGTVTLSEAITGGLWISSSSTWSIATVDVTSGVVTGVSAGVVIITYLYTGSCYATVSVTVNPLPDDISGNAPICAGSAITLTDATTGCLWSSGSPAIASVGAFSGIVTGLLAGTATISYKITSTGCYTTTVVIVEPAPLPIAGSGQICLGESIILTEAFSGGTWSSSDPTVGTVDAFGNVSGVGIGTATITYIVSSGCYATAPVTVNPLPDGITGSGPVCMGSTVALGDATSGGSWTSSDITIGSVDGSGNVTGVSAGIVTISYTMGSDGCFTTIDILVNKLPKEIEGVISACPGFTILLTDATPSGSWSSSDVTIGTIDGFGDFTGIAIGTTVITYSLPTGCYVTAVEDVALPPGISGVTGVCVGSSTTLTDATSGGSWSSSDIIIGPIDPYSGIFTGVTPGTAIITYMLPSDCFVTTTVSVGEVASACVTSIADYSYNFTSTCSGTSEIYYNAYDWMGGFLPPTGSTPPADLAFSSLPYLSPVEVCVIGVVCNGCYSPVPPSPCTCAYINDFIPRSSTGSGSNNTAQKNIGEIKIVPNPNNGIFNITGTLPGNTASLFANVEVINLLGQTVYMDISNVVNGVIDESITLNNNLANGVYIIRIKNGDVSQVIKFTLNR